MNEKIVKGRRGTGDGVGEGFGRSANNKHKGEVLPRPQSMQLGARRFASKGKFL